MTKAKRSPDKSLVELATEWFSAHDTQIVAYNKDLKAHEAFTKALRNIGFDHDAFSAYICIMAVATKQKK